MGHKVTEIRKNISDFLTWWGTELDGLLPVQVKHFFHTEGKSVQVTFGALGTEVFLPTEEGNRRKSFEFPFPDILDQEDFLQCLREEILYPVSIHLSDELTLQRMVELPRAAKGNLHNIIRLQIPRLLPMKVEDIYFDISSREQKDHVAATLAMIPRQRVERILEVFSAAGCRVGGVKAGANGIKAGFTFLNIAKQHKEKEHRLVSWLTASLTLLSVLLLSLYYVQLSAREEFLLEKRNSLSQDARAIEALSREIQKFDQQQTLYQGKIDRLRLDEILSTFTDLLPDDSWIFDFALNGDRITVTGKTSNASQLVEKIDSSPLFENVTNSSTRIASGRNGEMQERFSISFVLEGRRDE